MKLLGMLVFAAACVSCKDGGDEGEGEGTLEIGYCEIDGVPHMRDTDAAECTKRGTFRLLGDGDDFPIVLGSNALNMVSPSLRAHGANPRTPDFSVTASLDSIVAAGDLDFDNPTDMRSVGNDDYVLWGVRVPLQMELCCVNCREAVIDAELRDGAGRLFRGSVRVRISRASCPDECVCCWAEDLCPQGIVGPLCPLGGGTDAGCAAGAPRCAPASCLDTADTPDGGAGDGGT